MLSISLIIWKSFGTPSFNGGGVCMSDINWNQVLHKHVETDSNFIDDTQS